MPNKQVLLIISLLAVMVLGWIYFQRGGGGQSVRYIKGLDKDSHAVFLHALGSSNSTVEQALTLALAKKSMQLEGVQIAEGNSTGIAGKLRELGSRVKKTLVVIYLGEGEFHSHVGLKKTKENLEHAFEFLNQTQTPALLVAELPRGVGDNWKLAIGQVCKKFRVGFISFSDELSQQAQIELLSEMTSFL